MIDFVVRLASYKGKGKNLDKYRHPLLLVYFFVVIVSNTRELMILEIRWKHLQQQLDFVTLFLFFCFLFSKTCKGNLKICNIEEKITSDRHH